MQCQISPTLRDPGAGPKREVAVAAPHFLDGQMMKILVQVDRMLDAILVDLLFEIAVPVKQSDRDEIQVEIAG